MFSRIIRFLIAREVQLAYFLALLFYMLREKKESSWNSFDKKIREEIKDNFLKNLGQPDPDDLLRSIAGTAIAKMTVIKFPLNEDNNIIRLLTQNASNRDAEIRKSWIMAIKRLGHEFRMRKIKPSLETVNQLLSGIFFGLKNYGKLDISRFSVIALMALTEVLSFAGKLLVKGTAHQEILKSREKLITYDDEGFRRAIMVFLVEFVRLYSELVKDVASEI